MNASLHAVAAVLAPLVTSLLLLALLVSTVSVRRWKSAAEMWRGAYLREVEATDHLSERVAALKQEVATCEGAYAEQAQRLFAAEALVRAAERERT